MPFVTPAADDFGWYWSNETCHNITVQQREPVKQKLSLIIRPHRSTV